MPCEAEVAASGEERGAEMGPSEEAADSSLAALEEGYA